MLTRKHSALWCALAFRASTSLQRALARPDVAAARSAQISVNAACRMCIVDMFVAILRSCASVPAWSRALPASVRPRVVCLTCSKLVHALGAHDAWKYVAGKRHCSSRPTTVLARSCFGRCIKCTYHTSGACSSLFALCDLAAIGIRLGLLRCTKWSHHAPHTTSSFEKRTWAAHCLSNACK